MSRNEIALAIDVEGEIRTIGSGSLAGPWQLAAEIVRHLLRRGAEGVDVRFRFGSCVVEPQDRGCSAEDLRVLAEALDATARPEERDLWIGEVERRGLHPLLAVARLRGGRLWIRPMDGGGGLELREGGVARWSDRATARAPRGGAVLRGRGAAGRRAREWLGSVAALAPVGIVVDGRRVSGPLGDGVFRVRLAGPPPVQIAVGSEARAPRLDLLLHGIVATRASVPGSPPFAAAVELGGEASATATAAELRRAVTAYLPWLISTAVATGLRVAGRLPEMPEPARRRVTRMLLTAAVRDIDRETVMACQLVPRVRPGGVEWMTPEYLRDESRGRPPVRLSLEEAALLEELTGTAVAVASVPGANPERALIERLRAAWEAARRGRPVPESDLAPDERAVVAAAAGCGVELCFHTGAAAGVRREGVLSVGRFHRRVRDAVRRVVRRPDDLYPALAALDPDPAALPDGLSASWARRKAESGKGGPPEV